MTDTQVVDAPATEAPAETKAKPEKVVKQPQHCLCSYFELQGSGEDETFTTGCEQTTMRQFAQGHDARLVSFLVSGYFDGYTLRYAKGGTGQSFGTPAEAAAIASEALRDKAAKATENRKAKEDAAKARKDERELAKAKAAADKARAAQAKKAEAEAKKAAKATEPKATGAEVVAGSVTGDQTPLAEGEQRIKVGRWEYVATIDGEGNATFTDGKGEPQTINRDGYRVLEPTA